MKDESPEDIRDVVSEHGPATEMHMKSDHKAGVHQVSSTHGSFTHHSKHGSAHEAHKHMGHALGMSEGDEKETPEMESAEESKPIAGIPGMG
jgi:hypothetical protein